MKADLDVAQGDGQGVWSDSGYVTEIPYTKHYLRYQSPIAMSFAAATNQFTPPDIHAPFRYCDLGCGEAVTLLNLAAAYPQGQFTGVDLNHDHINHARDLAARAGLTNVTLFAGTFDAFADATEQSFDFIASHGVYSWVSAQVVASLHRVVEKTLKSGGLFYFCHFVRPGGSRTEVLFQLIETELKKTTGPLVDRAQAAVFSAQKLIVAQGSELATRYPFLAMDLNELASRDPRYLVHEFCNKYFRPQFFSEVVQELGAIGLDFVGSTKSERNDIRNILPDDPERLSGLSFKDAEIRASLLSDDEFRWDVFQKDADIKQLNKTDINNYYFDSVVFPYAYPKKGTLWKREVSFETAAFQQIIDAGHTGTKTIGDLLLLGNANPDDLRSALMDMVASHLFQPLLQPAKPPFGKASTVYELTHPLSRCLFERDFFTEGSTSFASPITGSAFVYGGFQAIAAYTLHGRNFPDCIAAVRKTIRNLTPAALHQVGIKYESQEAYFAKETEVFQTRTLPKLLKYGIIAPRVMSP